jgi:hypothetical protein
VSAALSLAGLAEGLREVARMARCAHPVPRSLADASHATLADVAGRIERDELAMPEPSRTVVLLALRDWCAELSEYGALHEPTRTALHIDQLARVIEGWP